MKQNDENSVRTATGARSRTTLRAQPKHDPASRRRPTEPGYYLIRLRLRYAHKGTRPLAKIP